MKESEKKTDPLDGLHKIEYISSRNIIIEQLKLISLNLARFYDSNITVEFNINPKMESVKISIKEFL